MQRIIVFEEKAYMMKRIKDALKDSECKVYEANTYKDLNSLLDLDLLDANIIIADLDFTKELEVDLISKYLDDHPETIFIVTAPMLTKKTFIEGISIGASDYFLQTISNDELRRKINKYLKVDDQSHIAINVIINLRKYISGELQKASKGNYKLSLAFTTLSNENNRAIPKNKTTAIAKYFSNSYWDTDSLVIYGDNHLLSIFPFCNRETVELVELKLLHLFAEFKSTHIDMAKYNIHNTYATFPEEGISLEDILRIVERKIEIETKTNIEWLFYVCFNLVY